MRGLFNRGADLSFGGFGEIELIQPRATAGDLVGGNTNTRQVIVDLRKMAFQLGHARAKAFGIFNKQLHLSAHSAPPRAGACPSSLHAGY